MKELSDGLILYHGSYCEVNQPMLEKCSKRKDFGRGFYLTTSREQAVSFLKTAIIKAEIGIFACQKLEKLFMMSLRNYGATVPPILRIYIGRNLKLTERKENSRKAHLQALRHRNKKIGVTGFEPAASTSRT